MQKKRKLKERVLASLIAFILVFTDFAPLGSALVSFAADNSADRINFSAQFVEIAADDSEVNEPNAENVENSENSDGTGILDEPENSDGTGILDEPENSDGEGILDNPVDFDVIANPEENTPILDSEPEEPSTVQNPEEKPETEAKTILALELVVGVQRSGYLKNAKIDIKNLENQIFTLKSNELLGEYVQSIQDNKIKLKQINSGIEVRVYIPIEVKSEEYIDVKKIQEGVQVILSGTYVDETGSEEIITKDTKAVLNVTNNVNFVVDSEIEKFIPYVRDGINCALVQLRVNGYSETGSQLPIQNSQYEMVIPKIENASVENLSVSAIHTGYTNGHTGNAVVFTNENWSYEFEKVGINIDNVQNDMGYKMSNGKDEFIISYTYVNCPENMNTETLKAMVSGKSNVFTPQGTTEVSASKEKEYDLSQANSNIITYEVNGKSQEVSKGYLYANDNVENPEYEIEFETGFSVNISRVDLLNIVEVRERAEYFTDEFGNVYNTSTENGINSYYKSVRLHKENLLSIIGETGNFELLLEDGTSLIQINKDTADDGDGFVTIDFGENRIDKILMRINNPVGEGILNIETVKAIAKTTYKKAELRNFRELVNEYVAAAALTEGIITEMGDRKTSVILKDTITDATVSLNRNELSTLVDNEDVEINISLNNASDISDVYNNPVFELTFPDEVEEINIKDIKLLYGNEEFDISNVETLKNENGNVIIRVTLSGMQSKYTLGDSDKGTTVILKTDIKVDMYRASRDTEIVMNYINYDATNYAIGADLRKPEELTRDVLIGREGTYDTSLKIVAPEGFVNAQMISGYKDDASIISVNQGTKRDRIESFKVARDAEMKMILINNTNENMNDVHILGRTIFAGNKDIINNSELGTNQDAPMISGIVPLARNVQNVEIYYSENGEATDDLENSENGWVVESDVQDFKEIKSYLIVVDGQVNIGDILMFAYNFEIPEKLGNNLDLCGTFGTYYVGEETRGIGEADKVVLSTVDAPVLKVETTSDVNQKFATEGQHIKFTVKVRNEGRSISENTVVKSVIPEGTTYVENGVLRTDVKELNIDMGNIEPGEAEEVTYEVQVNSSSANIETDNKVNAEGLENPIDTEKDSIPVETAQVSIDFNCDQAGRIVEENKNMYYTATITNNMEEPLHNCRVVQSIPEGIDVVEAYIEEYVEETNSFTKNEGIYNPSTRTVTWMVDSIDTFKAFKVIVNTNEIEELERELVSSIRVSSNELNKEYVSNEIISTLARPQLEVSYYSSNDNRYIKEGDTIQYILEISNTGRTSANKINIENIVSEEMRATAINCIKNNNVYAGHVGKNASVIVKLEPGETAKVVMDCTAHNLPNSVDEKFTGNSWTISGTNLTEVSTPKIENIVQQNPTTVNYNYGSSNSNVKRPTGDTAATNAGYVANVETKVADTTPQVEQPGYRILGRAFNDINNNGQRDDDEEGMGNVVAKLYNVSSQQIVAQTVTNSIGEYLFDNVVAGEYYIKFEYDTTKYKLADYKKEGVTPDRNSDAIISNYKVVTDKISIVDRSISDIDIGLVRAGIFDLSLDANLNRIIVQDSKEMKTYEMENSKLAKVDINPKYVNESEIYAEYTVSVTNKGEIAGYVKRIVDYLPEGLSLDTGMNPNWYIGADGNAYTNELEDVLIQPGETKEVKIILTKKMTEDGTGIVNNIFEIAQTYNEYAIADIDSVEGNRAEGEDDMSSSDMIIGIQTGGGLINIMLISTTLITLLIALYVIKIQVDKKTKEGIV